MSDSGATAFRVVGPDEGQAMWFTDNRMTIKATGADTGGAYGLTEAHAPAGFSPPLHVHHKDDEAFWILEGELTVRCGDDEAAAGPGTFVFMPRNLPHSFVVEGGKPAKLLALISPGGGEGFILSAGKPAEGPGLPPASPPDVPALMQAAGVFGTELVGPPLQPKG